MRQQVVETLLLLCVRHLFGLDNPNQVADALKLPKTRRDAETIAYCSNY